MSNGHPKGVEYKRIRSDKILLCFEFFSNQKNMIWSDPFGDKRQKKPEVGLDKLIYELSAGFFGIFLAQKFEHK
jgi:hypothetical protein